MHTDGHAVNVNLRYPVIAMSYLHVFQTVWLTLVSEDGFCYNTGETR